jgi:transcriptional regulator with XRE-family HTH domain
MDESLGSYLRNARRIKNLTLRDVEKRTGISNAYLSQLENNKILCPSPTILHKLSECYDVPYGSLMRLAGYPVPTTSEQSPVFRMGSSFDDLTPEEREEVMEFIEFLRSKRRRQKWSGR